LAIDKQFATLLVDLGTLEVELTLRLSPRGQLLTLIWYFGSHLPFPGRLWAWKKSLSSSLFLAFPLELHDGGL
jgi:hypothetical protein